MNTNIKRFWGIGAVLIGVTALGLFSQVSRAQNTPTSNSEVGRYKLTVVGQTNPYVFLLDTKTGKCWFKFQPADKQWQNATPAQLAVK